MPTKTQKITPPKKLWRNILKTSQKLKEVIDNGKYLIFFDTETTGLKYSIDRIIQISAIKTDKNLNEIERFNSYANPYPLLVTPKITEITGITNLQVSNAPLEEDVIKSFAKFCEKSIFIAYNSEFDASMLESAFLRYGIKINVYLFVVREMAYDMLPESKDFKLSTVCSEIKLDIEGKFHDSMYDVEMTLAFFKKYYTFYIDFKDTENSKPKAKVFALNPWSIGKNRRLYVPTSVGCFYYDMIKKNWGEKDGLFEDVNMNDVEAQALNMAYKKGYTSLSNVKESVSYRDL